MRHTFVFSHLFVCGGYLNLKVLIDIIDMFGFKHLYC